MLLTRSPLTSLRSIRKLRLVLSVRLACVRHAASVRPEPGSNSPLYLWSFASSVLLLCLLCAVFPLLDGAERFLISLLIFRFCSVFLYWHVSSYCLVFNDQRYFVLLVSLRRLLELYRLYFPLSTAFVTLFYLFSCINFKKCKKIRASPLLELAYSISSHTIHLLLVS